MKRTKYCCFPLLLIFLSSIAFCAETTQFSPYRGFSPEDEVVIARGENTKLFRRENGRFIWRIFLHPVHKVNEKGKFVDIGSTPAKPFWNPGQDCAGYADLLSWPEYVCLGTIWINEPCYYGFSRFNTEGIPDGSIVDTVKLSLYCETNASMSGTHDIYSMENRPSGSSNPYSLAADTEDGELYVNDFFPWQNTWYTWILGDDQGDYACQQMMDLLPFDWFAVGLSDWSTGWLAGSITYSGEGAYLEIPEPTAVNLVSFTATPNIDQVILKWQTEFEIDNLAWIIERRSKNVDYSVIGTLPGQHTKPTPSNYLFTDRDVLPGEEYYYRLTDVSIHGYQSSHDQISVHIPSSIGRRLKVSPTVFSDKLMMNIRGVYGKSATLTIYDETGRVAKKINISANTSPITIEWNATESNGQKVNDGIYFIRLSINGNKPETRKVVLLK